MLLKLFPDNTRIGFTKLRFGAFAFSSALIVSVLWVIGQYSLIFSTGGGALSGWIGGLKNAFMAGVGAASTHPNAPTIPEVVFSLYQLMFAIITVALISGAVVERMNFKAWFIFTFLWSILVYTPLAHLVWNPEGWLFIQGLSTGKVVTVLKTHRRRNVVIRTRGCINQIRLIASTS